MDPSKIDSILVDMLLFCLGVNEDIVEVRDDEDIEIRPESVVDETFSPKRRNANSTPIK
jgi:hypothetical protein